MLITFSIIAVERNTCYSFVLQFNVITFSFHSVPQLLSVDKQGDCMQLN